MPASSHLRIMAKMPMPAPGYAVCFWLWPLLASTSRQPRPAAAHRAHARWRQDARQPERLGEVAGDAEIDGPMRAGFGGVARDDDDGQVARTRRASRMTDRPSMPGIFRSVMSGRPAARRRSSAAGPSCRIDVVVRHGVSWPAGRARLLIVHNQNARSLGEPAAIAGHEARAARVQPVVDVTLAEAPLAPHANSGIFRPL